MMMDQINLLYHPKPEGKGSIKLLGFGCVGGRRGTSTPKFARRPGRRILRGPGATKRLDIRPLPYVNPKGKAGHTSGSFEANAGKVG